MTYNINNYNLFVFDLDGTIINTEIYHHLAWNAVLSIYMKKNINLSYNEYCKNFHININNNIYNYLKNEYNISDPKIFEDKNNIYLEYIKNNDIEFIGDSDIFIQNIINNNKKFIIVTNTLTKNIDF